MRAHRIAASVAVLLLASGAVAQQMSPEEEEMLEAMGIKGQPMGRKNTNPMLALNRADLKYIYCGVCRKMVEIALPKATELLEKRFKFQKRHKHEATEFAGEGAVQEYVETMCNPVKPEGEWVAKIDLVQEGDQLQLATQPNYGKCRKECRTVEQACNDVLDKADTEFTEILYAAVKDNTPLDKVQRYICNRAAGVCKKKPPPLKKREDEAFEVMTADEKQMWDMQNNLKETGMSGTMYKREDLAGMMDKLGDLTGMEGMEGMGDMEGAEGMEGAGAQGDEGSKEEL